MQEADIEVEEEIMDEDEIFTPDISENGIVKEYDQFHICIFNKVIETLRNGAK